MLKTEGSKPNVYSITTLRAYLAPFASFLMLGYAAIFLSTVFTSNVIAEKPPHINPMDISLVTLDAARLLGSMFAASFTAVEPSRSYSMDCRLVTLDAARLLRSAPLWSRYLLRHHGAESTSNIKAESAIVEQKHAVSAIVTQKHAVSSIVAQKSRCQLHRGAETRCSLQ